MEDLAAIRIGQRQGLDLMEFANSIRVLVSTLHDRSQYRVPAADSSENKLAELAREQLHPANFVDHQNISTLSPDPQGTDTHAFESLDIDPILRHSNRPRVAGRGEQGRFTVESDDPETVASPGGTQVLGVESSRAHPHCADYLADDRRLTDSRLARDKKRRFGRIRFRENVRGLRKS